MGDRDGGSESVIAGGMARTDPPAGAAPMVPRWAVTVSAILLVPLVAVLLVRFSALLSLAAAAAVFGWYAVARPRSAMLVLIPLSLLGAVVTQASVITGATVLVVAAVAARSVAGLVPLRLPHALIGLLTGLLLMS